MEKLTLISHGKACALCGSSLGSISSHFIMTNGLDCNDCAATWCSKKCKTKDIIHGPLKHNKGNKNRLVNCGNWTKFESFCQTNINETAYSLGIIYAKLLLNKSSSKTIRQHFETLCGVSQRIRNNLGDSTNIGGTLDASSGALTTEDPIPIWETTYKLFIDSFPTLKDEIDLETFLCHIGKLNINKVSNNQVYFITSFINHNCEPNIRYEIDSKLKLSVFARKDIKPGEQLFVTYVNPLHGVKLRRRALRVNYGFICKCSRCIKELDRLQTPQKSTGITMNYTKEKEGNSKNGLNLLFPPTSTTSKRRSSLRNKRPDLQELLKNGKEFDLEIPDVIGIGRRRRTSVRFDDTVAVAIEE